ncbi:MAG: membrane dipeptidase [Armatimonadetes bacterium]|nr:membrane dipeptidase [Armatimonadota bacterium]
MLVGVAHTGWQSCLDAAAASDRPIVISHSACHALNAHYRCKSDAVIRAVAGTGGYMGVCCIPAFLGGSGDIAAVLDHIDYIVRHFGPDCAAIGTDIVYSSSASDREYEKIPSRRRSRSGWEYFWPDPSPSVSHPLSQDHPSLAWTNWPLFTVGLVQRGHSDETIQKILGGNVLRVARAVCPGG